MKEYLEDHPAFIATPGLLNHGLHFDSVITQFSFVDGYTADFAYLTKSTANWILYLVEFESPTVTLFSKSGVDPIRSAKFNRGLNQIDDWRREVKRDPHSVRAKLRYLLVPFADNPLEVRFMLVVGRSHELATDDRKRASFGALASQDLTVLTYDSMTSAFTLRKYRERKNVLRLRKDGVHVRTLGYVRSLMAWLGPTKLHFTAAQIATLRSSRYDVDSWLSGDTQAFQENTGADV
jgi:hypothetical protein